MRLPAAPGSVAPSQAPGPAGLSAGPELPGPTAVGFLDLPRRTSKPRRRGITHAFDKGAPLAEIEARLKSAGDFVDVWKFGFGTSYLDPEAAAKNAALRRCGVKACPGGTLLEAAWAQSRVEAFFEWADAAGFDCVEVSRGATCLPLEAKHKLVAQAAGCGFQVFAEVGSKDPAQPVTPGAWIEEARADAGAGAEWIVAEGRESGDVGLYRADGSVRADLVDALETLTARVPVVYEAPRRAQQAWLIARLGPDVNLGNVAPADVLGLEAMRNGLRADTFSAVESVAKPGLLS